MPFSNNENKIIIIETNSFHPNEYTKKVIMSKRYIMISNEFIKKKYLY